MIEYPKIETVWVRDDKTHKVRPDEFRLPEFALVKEWALTEKVDGTNIRIGLNANGTVAIGGRTETAQVPTPLLAMLVGVFNAEALLAKFGDSDFTIFGEGYGPKIQSGGAYSGEPRYRIFDVRVGTWWLEPDDVAGVAATFGLKTVPTLGVCAVPPRDVASLGACVGHTLITDEGGNGRRAEGVVARAVPGLFTRKGERLMWKLKFKDFA
jgi:hypothetical protein